MKNTKKVLVLAASARRGGNSDLLCDEFVRGAQQAGHTVEKIFLRDKKVGYCTGCYYCEQSKGICAIKDDMADILEKIIQADVLVLGTPVYFYCMNAQLKTVTDRSVARYTEIEHKDAYLIATAGEDDAKAVEGTVTSLRGFLSCLNDVREAGMVVAHGVHAKGEVANTPYMQQAYEMGKNL